MLHLYQQLKFKPVIRLLVLFYLIQWQVLHNLKKLHLERLYLSDLQELKLFLQDLAVTRAKTLCLPMKPDLWKVPLLTQISVLQIWLKMS